MKCTKQVLTYTFPQELLSNLADEMAIIISEKKNNGWKFIDNGAVEEVNYSYVKISLSFERDYEE
jgi:hypothetical protein